MKQMRTRISKYNAALQWLAREGRMPPNKLSHSIYAAMRANGRGWDKDRQAWIVVERN